MPLPKYFRLAVVNKANQAINFAQKEFDFDNNLYWNNGSSVDPIIDITSNASKTSIMFLPSTDDASAILTDPVMDNPYDACTIASWDPDTYQFQSGETNIYDEHARLVEAHAILGEESSALGAADATNMPDHDIRQREYTGDPNVGCYQSTGIPPSKPSRPSGTAGTFYVSPDGTDTPSYGTEANPWKTIGYAITKMDDGGTLICKDGSYPAAGIYRKFTNPTYIVAENEYRAHVCSITTSVRALSVYNAKNIHFWGFDFYADGTASEYLIHISVTDGTYCENITFENCICRDAGTTGSQDYIKINSFPDNIVFRSCLFSHGDTAYCQQFFDINVCTNVTIEDCIFLHNPPSIPSNYRAFIIIKNSSTYNLAYSKDFIIRRNIFHRGLCQNAYGYIQLGEDAYSSEWEVQNCLIENNLFLFDNARISGYAYNYAAMSLLIYNGVTGTTFRANTCVGVPNSSLFLKVQRLAYINYQHYPTALRYPFPNRVPKELKVYNNIFANPENTAGTGGTDKRGFSLAEDSCRYSRSLVLEPTDPIIIKGQPWKKRGNEIIYGDEITLLSLDGDTFGRDGTFFDSDYIFGNVIDNSVNQWDGVLCTAQSGDYWAIQPVRWVYSETSRVYVCLDGSNDGNNWASSALKLQSEVSYETGVPPTQYAIGSQNNSINVILRNAANALLSTLTYTDIVVTITRMTGNNVPIESTLTLIPISSGAAHTDGGFANLGSGKYRIDLPDNCFAKGTKDVRIVVTAAGAGDIKTQTTLLHQQAKLVTVTYSDSSTGVASATITTGTQTNTYTATAAYEDEGEENIYHIVSASGGNIDFYYDIAVTSGLLSRYALCYCYAQGAGSTVAIQAYNNRLGIWDNIGEIIGTDGTEETNHTLSFKPDHTFLSGTYKTRVRFVSSTASLVAIDYFRCYRGRYWPTGRNPDKIIEDLPVAAVLPNTKRFFNFQIGDKYATT